MSANLIVDIGSTCISATSIGSNASVDETPASGVIIGAIVDLLHANTRTQIMAAGGGPATSGQFRVQVQESDGTTSGSFTDPTSGLAKFPDHLHSGGIMIVNSGGTFTSGVGGVQFGAFLRNKRYVRANVLGDDEFNGPVNVGFVAQRKQTGSGGGFVYSPGSGVVDV